MSEYTTKTGPELIAAYNAMVAEIHSLGRGGSCLEVKRFSSIEDGVKRCEKMAEALSIARENPNPDGPETAKVPSGTVTKTAEANASDETREKETTVAKKSMNMKPAKVAKKAKAEKAPKVAKTPKVAKEKDTGAPKMDGDFNMVRAGTNRATAIGRLLKANGSPVKLSAIITAVYGAAANETGEATGPIGMVIKGIGIVIDAHKLPYKLEKQKEGKEITFALIRKKAA